MEKRRKIPPCDGIRAQDLSVTGHVLYRSATNTAPKNIVGVLGYPGFKTKQPGKPSWLI